MSEELIPPAGDELALWHRNNKPADWEDWEWHRFLCGVARVYLTTAAHQAGTDLPTLIAMLSTPIPARQIERPN